LILQASNCVGASASRTTLARATFPVCALTVSQPCHALAEPGGYRRSQEDTKKIQFEYSRNRADATGHERTRPCAGSGP